MQEGAAQPFKVLAKFVDEHLYFRCLQKPGLQVGDNLILVIKRGQRYFKCLQLRQFQPGSSASVPNLSSLTTDSLGVKSCDNILRADAFL